MTADLFTRLFLGFDFLLLAAAGPVSTSAPH